MALRKTSTYGDVIRALLAWSDHTMQCEECTRFRTCDDASPCVGGRHLYQQTLAAIHAWQKPPETKESVA